jgi:hypothetical protein
MNENRAQHRQLLTGQALGRPTKGQYILLATRERRSMTDLDAQVVQGSKIHKSSLRCRSSVCGAVRIEPRLSPCIFESLWMEARSCCEAVSHDQPRQHPFCRSSKLQDFDGENCVLSRGESRFSALSKYQICRYFRHIGMVGSKAAETRRV